MAISEQHVAPAWKLENQTKKLFKRDEGGDFPPALNEFLQHLIRHHGGNHNKVQSNLDGGIPDGFNLLVLPMTETASGKRVVKDVATCAVPSLELVMSHKDGEEFIENAVINAFTVKLANAIRGGKMENAPRTLEDFIENRRKTGSDFSSFNEIADVVIKGLKKMGLTHITKVILRQCLSSKSAAETHYTKLPQVFWEKVLMGASIEAAQAGLDTSIFEDWKNTREERAFEEEDLDIEKLLGGMDNMLAEKSKSA